MGVRDSMREAMYDRLDTYFPQHYGATVPIGLENHVFEQPKNTPHLQTWFRYQPTKRASIGTAHRFDRIRGIFVVSCYVPEKSGTGTLWKMVDAVVDTYEATTFEVDGSYATLFIPYNSPSATVDGLYTSSVFVPFLIDTVPKR